MAIWYATTAFVQNVAGKANASPAVETDAALLAARNAPVVAVVTENAKSAAAKATSNSTVSTIGAVMAEKIWIGEQAREKYSPIRDGEFIRPGDLFQRTAGERRDENGQFEYAFETVTEDTEVDGKKLSGVMWLECYPRVLRLKS